METIVTRKAPIGVGLRTEHIDDVINTKPQDISWLEIITENYLDNEGIALTKLQQIRKHYPISFHGVSLSIASYEQLNFEYLNKVKELAKKIDPFMISDHLCWTGNKEINFHNLLPFTYDKNTLNFISDKVKQLQDFFERPFILENLSAYMSLKDSSLTEWDFFQKLCDKTGCLMLLDINNVYVNSVNQNFDPKVFIDSIDNKHIAEMHLAGFSTMNNFLFDTHSAPVDQNVWELFKYTLNSKDLKNVPILIEWDNNIPCLKTVMAEAKKAAEIWRGVYE